MNELLKKLNYKNQSIVYILNSPDEFKENLEAISNLVPVSQKLDSENKYAFLLAFVKSVDEVATLSKDIINNLVDDGVLWFAYPKKTSKKYKSNITRDFGWETLNDLGYQGVRLISIDDNWSAFRFRSVDHIKS